MNNVYGGDGDGFLLYREIEDGLREKEIGLCYEFLSVGEFAGLDKRSCG